VSKKTKGDNSPIISGKKNKIEDSFKTTTKEEEDNKEEMRLNFVERNKGFVFLVLVLIITAILSVGYFLVNKGIINTETSKDLINTIKENKKEN
jgi:hypothetical protein